MSKVDWPYFREIIKNIGKEIPWIVYCHSIDDRNNTNLFKSVFELSNTSVKIYRTKKLNNGSRVTGSAI